MSAQSDLKREIYKTIKGGDLGRAEEIALEGMEENINDSSWEVILKIIKFWQNRSEMFVFSAEINNGEALFSEWDKFVDFCIDNKVDNKKAFFAMKAYVFKSVVDLLIEAYKISPIRDKEILIILGQAFYEIGMVSKSIETLEYALSIGGNEENARIYMLLGDLYSYVGEDDMAQVMYNEAFFRFPQQVVLDNVEFPPIQKLKKMIKEDGFTHNEVSEWVPIYGYLYGGLTVRRKLEYDDYTELIEIIKDYEQSLKVDKKVVRIIIPRLVNYYLWVFDYYLYQVKAVNGARKVAKRIEELIKSIQDPEEGMQKIWDRTEALFKELLSKSWNVGVDTKVG